MTAPFRCGNFASMLFAERTRPAGPVRSAKSMEAKGLGRAEGSYVDGPLASVLFRRRTAGGLRSYVRPVGADLGPLALMKSDDPRLLIKVASSGLLTPRGVSDGLRSSRRVVHHVVVALAKLMIRHLLSIALPRPCSGLGVDGATEGLAGGHDRPDDPGELVGQRHGDDFGRFARFERGQPVAQRALALSRRPQDRDRA